MSGPRKVILEGAQVISGSDDTDNVDNYYQLRFSLCCSLTIPLFAFRPLLATFSPNHIDTWSKRFKHSLTVTDKNVGTCLFGQVISASYFSKYFSK
jgi:hypothetical protein